jgi:hypothetical protein
MPVGALCQGFLGNLSGEDYQLKTDCYEFFGIICFKKDEKKMTLS